MSFKITACVFWLQADDSSFSYSNDKRYWMLTINTAYLKLAKVASIKSTNKHCFIKEIYVFLIIATDVVSDCVGCFFLIDIFESHAGFVC